LYVAVEHLGMERRLFGHPLGESDDPGAEIEGEIDLVDEVAERKGAIPRRGDGGWVCI
jgi:hypothetical protein